MAIKFKYRILSEKICSQRKKPNIKVTLRGRSRMPIAVHGLLDSGADITVIPKGLAEFLDLKFGKKDVSRGIGGKIIVWKSYVTMMVRNAHEKYTLRNVPVQITDTDSIPLIIGRAGFFEKFEIIIDEAKEVIKLKSKSPLLK